MLQEEKRIRQVFGEQSGRPGEQDADPRDEGRQRLLLLAGRLAKPAILLLPPSATLQSRSVLAGDGVNRSNGLDQTA